jgi:hypothetical protein
MLPNLIESVVGRFGCSFSKPKKCRSFCVLRAHLQVKETPRRAMVVVLVIMIMIMMMVMVVVVCGRGCFHNETNVRDFDSKER